MSDFRPADHAMGLELQIEELTEQRQRAVVQGSGTEVTRLDREVAALQLELAATADRAATEAPIPEVGPELHDAEELNIDADPD